MSDDDVSEAKAMDMNSDLGASEWFADQLRSEYVDERYAALMRLRRLMRDARAASVGDTIRCAQCKKWITKKSYQTAFCSNKGRGNCRDRYHNRIAGLEAYLGNLT